MDLTLEEVVDVPDEDVFHFPTKDVVGQLYPQVPTKITESRLGTPGTEIWNSFDYRSTIDGSPWTMESWGGLRDSDSL